MTRTIGMLEATLASKPMGRFLEAARANTAPPCSASRFLLAVTTGLPPSSAARTSWRDWSVPPHDLHDYVYLRSANQFFPIGNEARTTWNVLRLNAERLAYDRNLEPNAASPLDQAGVLGDNARRGAANCAKADDTDPHCSHNFVKGHCWLQCCNPNSTGYLAEFVDQSREVTTGACILIVLDSPNISVREFTVLSRASFTSMTRVTSLNCDFRIECAILHSFGKACRWEGTTGRIYG
jgi:hypothetical protein